MATRQNYKRNHSKEIFNHFGLDKGFDIPGRTDYVTALKPLLDEFSKETGVKVNLVTAKSSALLKRLELEAAATSRKDQHGLRKKTV